MDWPLLLLAGISGMYLGVVIFGLGLWMAAQSVKPLPVDDSPSHTWRYRPSGAAFWND